MLIPDVSKAETKIFKKEEDVAFKGNISSLFYSMLSLFFKTDQLLLVQLHDSVRPLLINKPNLHKRSGSVVLLQTCKHSCHLHECTSMNLNKK